MDLVSAQYSDSEGELSDENSHLRPPKIPFNLNVDPPEETQFSSGHNSPGQQDPSTSRTLNEPPPPRGGRALSVSPDAVFSSAVGSSVQPSPLIETDSPFLLMGAARRPVKSRSPRPKLVSYIGDYGEDDDEGEDEEEDEEEEKQQDDEGGGSGLVPDYMSDMSYMDRTIPPPIPQTVPDQEGIAPPIPPEPAGRCSKQLQDKIAQQYERYLREEIDYNRSIQRRKDFKNPSIYEKLIQYSGIYEFGTNYPPEIFDPHIWGPESSYEELAKAQKIDMDRREEKRKGESRAKVEFVSGTAKKPSSSTAAAGGGDGDGKEKEKKRKSKWDQGTTAEGSSGSAPGAAPGAAPVAASSSSSTSLPDASTVPPVSAVLSQATGTKATVISATGPVKKSKS